MIFDHWLFFLRIYKCNSYVNLKHYLLKQSLFLCTYSMHLIWCFHVWRWKPIFLTFILTTWKYFTNIFCHPPSLIFLSPLGGHLVYCCLRLLHLVQLRIPVYLIMTSQKCSREGIEWRNQMAVQKNCKYTPLVIRWMCGQK